MAETENNTTSRQVLEEILAAADQHAEATRDFVENYSFYDRTLAEWGRKLSVEIPDQPDPDDLKNIYLEILRKIQTCNVLYTRANSTYTALDQGSAIKKADITTALVEKYEANKARRPASTVISQMADNYMDVGYLKTASKIARDFFKDQKDTLIEVRKTMEQLGFMMHLEVKLRE